MIVNRKWIREKYSELEVNSQKKVNLKLIRENDSELKVNPRNREWFESEFAEKIENWKWVLEIESEFKAN